MVTVRCMTILGNESEILLVLENSKSAMTRARERVCVRALPILRTNHLVNLREGRWLTSFYPIAQQPALICLWPIVEDGITTLCSSTALCQSELLVRCHLNETCKTCVRFLSVPTKTDLDDIEFRKVFILPDLGNWWRNMYLCVFPKFRYIAISYSLVITLWPSSY